MRMLWGWTQPNCQHMSVIGWLRQFLKRLLHPLEFVHKMLPHEQLRVCHTKTV
jgi:hypothetical protein